MRDSTRATDQEYLRTDQYRDSQKLSARYALHAKFSVNPHPWLRWVFEQLHLPDRAQVVELGCGRGDLWQRNRERIPTRWEITLSDFSPGMLEEARRTVADIPHPFSFQVIDILSIPLADASFDAVVANHMLYHVPTVSQALAEVRRILRPDGRFFASTNGGKHLHELWELLAEFTGVPNKAASVMDRFMLENGRDILSEHFSHVALSTYDDALLVTEAEPLVAYVLSMMDESVTTHILPRADAFRAFVTEYLAPGSLHIHKYAGIFEAWN